MKMNLIKAIDILKEQKAKLETVDLRNDNWKTQTSSFIKDFFGEGSQEFIFFNKFTFYSKTFDEASYEYDTQANIKKNKIVAASFIENCIDTLKQKGLFKPTKANFLNRLSETALWTIISIGVPGLLSIGFLSGNIYSDKQNFELRQENRNLKDTLLILRSSTNQKTNIRADTVINKSIENHKD